MTDADIIEWLFMLAPTNAKRRTMVLDLAKCHLCQEAQISGRTCQHRYGELSTEDMNICDRGLALLEAGAVAEAAGPIHIDREQLAAEADV